MEINQTNGILSKFMINLKKYDNTEIKNLLQLSDFSSGVGWIKFPDGTMIQYSNCYIPVGLGTSENPLTVVMHNNFVGTYVVTTTCIFANLHNCIYSVFGEAEKQFKIRSSDPYTANNFYWIAIGRWK